MADLNTSVSIRLIDAFSTPLKNIGARVADLGRVMNTFGAGANKAMESFSRTSQLTANLSQTSAALSRFGAQARSAIESPFSAFVDFEKGMKKLQAVGNLDNSATGQLAAFVKAKSVEIGASTADIQQSFESLIAAGFDLDASKVMSGESFKLGRGNNLTNDAATDLLVSTMQSFGLKSAKDAKHTANVLAAADDVSSASAGQLGDFLSRTGSTAKGNNTSLESMAAIGAVLKDAGRKDLTDTSTSVNNVMNRLASPSALGKKALASVGIQGRELTSLRTDVTSGNMLAAIGKIDKAFDGLTAAQRTDKVKAIFGEGGQEMSIFRDLTAALNDGSLAKKIDKFTNGVAGTTDRKAATMGDSDAARLEKMRAKWDVFLVNLGEKLSPALQRLSDAFIPLIDRMADWIAKNPDAVETLAKVTVGIAALATVMAPIVGAVASVISTLSFATTGIIVLGTVVKSLSVAVGVAAAPLLGAVAAALGVGLAIGTLIAKFTSLDEYIGNKFFDWFNDKPEEGPKKGQQGYADGTILDANGKVVKLGTGNADLAPKVVRDARAGGAKTAEEVNAFTQRAAPNPAAPAASPIADRGAADIVAAIEASTRAAEKANRELMEEQRRNRPRRSTNGGSTGAGQGAY